MNEKLFHGVYAALLTPRLPDGAPDLPAWQNLLAFHAAHGMRRFAVNGATGEFCLTTPSQLDALLRSARANGGGALELLCGVGAAGLEQSLALVRVAEANHVQGLLLPMPYFFPYSQGDLHAFCSAVARSTSLPVLLYNLPQFTSGLETGTVCDLVQSVENIVGVKDSSGSHEILSALTDRAPGSCRLVGNDAALVPALKEGICDGVVSGVACVLPDLIAAVYGSGSSGADEVRSADLLDDMIARLGAFPTPWGLKWAAEARGILPAAIAQPVSSERLEQARIFQRWFREVLAENDFDYGPGR